MRKSLVITGTGFAILNVLLWFSCRAIRDAVDAADGRLDSPIRPFIVNGVQELLVYYDPWLARLVLPLVFTLGFALIPLLLWESDSSADRPTISQAFHSVSLTLLWSLEFVWLFLIGVGLCCRGPNWVFYWPHEKWDLSRLEVLNLVNLSEYFWDLVPGTSHPASAWWVRELPGFLFLAAYFVGGMLLVLYLNRKNPKLHRLLLVTLIFQLALLVPLKMAGRFLFDLKYFIAVPEFFFNL